MTADTADHLFDLRHAATDRVTIVVVPERRMLAIDGVGAPTGTDHRRALDTLHDVADLLRRRVNREHHLETRLGAVECAWWVHPEPAPGEVPVRFEDRGTWHWQLLMEIPKRATDEDVEAALAEARSSPIPHAGHVHAIRFAEGRSAQILQLGGPAASGSAVAQLYREVEAAGLHPHGHLHEIHLADPRLVPADRQRVILRLPIATAAT